MSSIARKDRYVSLKKIGNGEYGTIYKAQRESDPEPRRWYTLKRLKEDDRKVFANEVDMLRQIGRNGHRNVAEYVEHYVDDGWNVVVLEYASGASLGSYVNNGVVPNDWEIRTMVEGVLEGLRYIHSSGVVHRDVKPENIILGFDRAVLIDFGLSCRSSEPVRNIVGSPLFFSPEKMNHVNNEQALKASDVWAFGITMYMLLHGGRDPFDNTADLVELKARLRDNRLLPFAYPSSFYSHVYRCSVVHDYRQRFSAASLLASCREFYAGLGRSFDRTSSSLTSSLQVPVVPRSDGGLSDESRLCKTA